MVTKIILLRHGETTGNVENRVSGITDFRLTPNGKNQAKEVAHALFRFDIDVVYSSPLNRAVETAKIIFKNKKEIKICEDLREINFGECDGMSWEEIDRKYPNVRKDWKEVYFYPINIPKQEDFWDFQRRIKNVINKIVKENPQKCICIVLHGLAIFSFIAYINESKGIKVFNQLNNCQYIVIDYENDKYKIV